MFQFIHAADIHLDSPLKGLMRFESAPVERIQSATREAFCNLVQFALDERVSFILIAGDLWDGDWPDSGPGLFFIHQVSRLEKAGIRVFVVKGNHDAQSQLTTAIRDWPSNVTVFSHKKPESVRLDQWNVAIHGQSYAHQHVTEDLSTNYPAPVSGAFNIGMLHTCLEDGGTDYAPACLHKLVASGYDYWALGHIHDRQDLSQGRVHIEFPGNIQGRSIRETGPKGCTLVSVADDHSVVTRFQALDVVRWQEVSVEADDHNLEIHLRNALQTALLGSEGRLLAIRLHVRGSVENGQALRDRADAIAVELGEIWIEKILVKPRPERRDGTGLQSFQLGTEIRQALDELETDDVIVAEWMQGFHRLREHLTGELSETDPARIMGDPKAFRALAAQVAKGLA